VKNYQQRDKFFYVSPELIKKWPYKSRYAIGMNFGDFRAIDSPVFRFKVKGVMYEIPKWKALALGSYYKCPGGMMPNLIPLEEFSICKK
jgi:hypothetical protein